MDDPNVIDLLRTKILWPPSELSYNLSRNLRYSILAHGSGWPFINKNLIKIFSDKPQGFFVEAGALDGEFLSNTLWLERKMGWRGLLVEPNKRSFQKMVLKRRKAWLANACLSNEKYPKGVVMVSSEKKSKDRILSVIVSGASYQTSSNITKYHSTFYDNTYSAYHYSQCYPLYSFLLALNVTTIDFLSLDMQGVELDVFNTIPLDKININALVIEDYRFYKYNTELVKHFNKNGFMLLDYQMSGLDYFFINRKYYREADGIKKKIIDDSINNVINKVSNMNTTYFIEKEVRVGIYLL